MLLIVRGVGWRGRSKRWRIIARYLNNSFVCVPGKETIGLRGIFCVF